MWLDFKDDSGMDWMINTDHVIAIRVDKTELHVLLSTDLTPVSRHVVPIRSFANDREAAEMLRRIRDALHEGAQVFSIRSEHVGV